MRMLYHNFQFVLYTYVWHDNAKVTPFVSIIRAIIIVYSLHHHLSIICKKKIIWFGNHYWIILQSSSREIWNVKAFNKFYSKSVIVMDNNKIHIMVGLAATTTLKWCCWLQQWWSIYVSRGGGGRDSCGGVHF